MYQCQYILSTVTLASGSLKPFCPTPWTSTKWLALSLRAWLRARCDTCRLWNGRRVPLATQLMHLVTNLPSHSGNTPDDTAPVDALHLHLCYVTPVMTMLGIGLLPSRYNVKFSVDIWNNLIYNILFHKWRCSLY